MRIFWHEWWMRCKSGFPSQAQTCGQTNKDFHRFGIVSDGKNHLTMQLTGPSASPLGALRGWTSVHCAAQNGHDSVVQRLLAAGAAVDAVENDGHGLGKGILRGGIFEWQGWEGEMMMGRKWMQWRMMAMASGRGFWREVWRWLPDDANNVNRTCWLKVGDRLNEFQVLEKPERNMKKPQSFKETWKKTHFDGLGVELWIRCPESACTENRRSNSNIKAQLFEWNLLTCFAFRAPSKKSIECAKI